MAIRLNELSNITYGTSPVIPSPATMTLISWVRFTGSDAYWDIGRLGFFPNRGFIFQVSSINANYPWTPIFNHYFGDSYGQYGGWHGPNNALSAGVWMIAVTYDNSSTSNNPIIYINGVAVTTTRYNTPVGTAVDYSDVAIVEEGNYNMEVLQTKYFNRILSAEEILQIYSARGNDNIKNGLVFCPVLYGAKGTQVFDGAVLSTSNTIIDPCSGVIGVPNGSPVAVGETYLRP